MLGLNKLRNAISTKIRLGSCPNNCYSVIQDMQTASALSLLETLNNDGSVDIEYKFLNNDTVVKKMSEALIVLGCTDESEVEVVKAKNIFSVYTGYLVKTTAILRKRS